MSEYQLHTKSVKGMRLAWREAGSGPAIVFLHGIGSGSQGWEAQLDHFAPSYRAIAWDAPGYGGSDELEPEAPAAGDYAEALAGLLSALEIEAAHLVGNSLGSLFAGAFVKIHRGRVLSMVLSDPPLGHADADALVRASSLAARLEGVNELGPEAMARKRAPHVVAPGTSEEILAKVRGIMAEVRPRGYSQAAHALSNGNLIADLADCNAPVLVLTGSEDVVTLPEGGRRVARNLFNGRFELLGGVGHLPYIEAPAAFNTIVGDFLAQYGSGSA